MSSSSSKAFQPSPHLRGLFVGSGSDGMNEPTIAQAVLQLTEKQPVKVAYVGTATYDLEGPRMRQTEQFVRQGCKVESLNVAMSGLTQEGQELIDSADIIIVSGGNTLYAMDRWKILGLDETFRQAMERGAVLTGGSAGAICWFDGGHSDSMDPETWKDAMSAASTIEGDESSNAPESQDAKEWVYIRIQGLKLLPGLVCPHHDKVQSNGVLRATDFDSMLLRHPTELGIGIDHWAALQVNGDSYTVLSIPDKEGSVLPDGRFSSERKGRPGIWIKSVQDGQVKSRLCPSSGKLSELLFHPKQIRLDPKEEECRKQNPAQ
eukprot:scaffold14635_cov201-Amphora_coffeaeformis.AAC.12